MILKGGLISEGISNFHFDPIHGVPSHDIMSNKNSRDLPNGGQNLPPMPGIRLLPIYQKTVEMCLLVSRVAPALGLRPPSARMYLQLP